MLKPTECQTAVSRFIVRQLTHHLTLRTGMGKHVDEVEYYDVQRSLYAFELTNHPFAEITLVDLPVIETLPSAVTVQ